MARYGPINASPEADPKVPAPGGPIVRPPPLNYTCDYGSNIARALFGAAPRVHFRCTAAPIGRVRNELLTTTTAGAPAASR